MKEHIIVIREDSTCRIIPYAQDSTSEQLKQLQTLVGGQIETVPCKGQDLIMLVDEEGTFKDYHVNKLASEVTRFNAVIIGKAVIAKTAVDADGESDIVGMSVNEAVEWLMTLARDKGHSICIEVGGDTEC